MAIIALLVDGVGGSGRGVAKETEAALLVGRGCEVGSAGDRHTVGFGSVDDGW